MTFNHSSHRKISVNLYQLLNNNSQSKNKTEFYFYFCTDKVKEDEFALWSCYSVSEGLSGCLVIIQPHLEDCFRLVISYHGKYTGDSPDYESHIDTACVLEDSCRRYKDARSNDRAHNHSNTIEEAHFGLKSHIVSRRHILGALCILIVLSRCFA